MSDYIKREDAMVAVEKFGGRLNDEVLYEMKFALFILPTADVVEVKHGKWTIRATSYRDMLNYECSVCHKRYLRGTGENFKYCPNCGAKMDGEGRK